MTYGIMIVGGEHYGYTFNNAHDIHGMTRCEFYASCRKYATRVLLEHKLCIFCLRYLLKHTSIPEYCLNDQVA